MYLLRILSGPMAHKTVPIERYPFIIGRTSSSRGAVDLDFADPSVSRRHAVISMEHGIPLLESCGAGRTLLNGKPVTGHCPLKSDDEITIADQILVFQDQKTVTEKLAEMSADSAQSSVLLEEKPPRRRLFYLILALITLSLITIIFFSSGTDSSKKTGASVRKDQEIVHKRKRIDTMTYNERCKWALQSERLYREKNLSKRNLFDAHIAIRKAAQSFTFHVIPADSLDKWQEMERQLALELKNRFDELRSLSVIALRQERPDLCNAHLAEIMAMFPDVQDRRYLWAHENYLRFH